MLNNKKFISIENKKGLSSTETVFHYHQSGNVITGSYSGGPIKEGFIVGKAVSSDNIELLFHCITNEGELMSGESKGVISTSEDGSLRLKFIWSWLNGDRSGGISEYKELS